MIFRFIRYFLNWLGFGKPKPTATESAPAADQKPITTSAFRTFNHFEHEPEQTPKLKLRIWNNRKQTRGRRHQWIATEVDGKTYWRKIIHAL